MYVSPCCREKIRFVGLGLYQCNKCGKVFAEEYLEEASYEANEDWTEENQINEEREESGVENTHSREGILHLC